MRSKWITLVASGVLVLGACASDPDDAGTTLTVVSMSERTTIATAPADSVARTSTTAATIEPVGTLGITRPVFDDSVCVARSADEREIAGDRTFFAQSSDAPVTVQVIAEPDTTPADPFALLLRYPAGEWRREGGDSVEVGGNLVSLRVFPNGNGAATWDLPDGSTGYLRSRGLGE